MYFKTAIRYQQENELGKLKTFNDTYLFDAVSFSEVENKIARKQLDGEFPKNVTIKTISPFEAGEIVFHPEPETDDLKWYRLKYYYMDAVEGSSPKRTIGYMMIQAQSSKSALWDAATAFSKWLITVYVDTLTETKLVSIFPHRSEDND